MKFNKNTKAASMVGYGLVAGLIAVAAIASLESTGDKSDRIFLTAGIKLDAASKGESVSVLPPVEPEGAIIVTSDLTEINGTPGDDLFIVFGENAGTDGPEIIYQQSDIQLSTGNLDLSDFVTLADINGRATSSLNAAATFNGNGGNDTLVVFGNADLQNIQNSPFSNIFLNSGIKLDAANPMPGNKITGNEKDSYVEFTGTGPLTLDSSLNINGIATLAASGNLQIQIDDTFDRTGHLKKIESKDGAEVTINKGTFSKLKRIGGDSNFILNDVSAEEVANIEKDENVKIDVETGSDPMFASVHTLFTTKKGRSFNAAISTFDPVAASRVDTSDTPFGKGIGASFNIPYSGSGESIAMNRNTQPVIGRNSFTLETWVKTTSSGWLVGRGFHQKGREYQSKDWSFYLIGSGVCFMFNSTSCGLTWTLDTEIKDGQWHHLALVRDGNTWSVFVDGIKDDEILTSSANIGNRGASFGWTSLGYPQTWGGGARPQNNHPRWQGKLSDIRVTAGARYTDNFDLPTLPFPKR